MPSTSRAFLATVRLGAVGVRHQRHVRVVACGDGRAAWGGGRVWSRDQLCGVVAGRANRSVSGPRQAVRRLGRWATTRRGGDLGSCSGRRRPRPGDRVGHGIVCSLRRPDPDRTSRGASSRGHSVRRKLEAAPVLFHVAAAGDAVASAIVRQQTEDIVAMATVALRQLDLLDEPVPVMLGGLDHISAPASARSRLRAEFAPSPAA